MPKKKKDGEPGTDNTHILNNLPSKLKVLYVVKNFIKKICPHQNLLRL